jgi:hypothetical protein
MVSAEPAAAVPPNVGHSAPGVSQARPGDREPRRVRPGQNPAPQVRMRYPPSRTQARVTSPGSAPAVGDPGVPQ